MTKNKLSSILLAGVFATLGMVSNAAAADDDWAAWHARISGVASFATFAGAGNQQFGGTLRTNILQSLAGAPNNLTQAQIAAMCSIDRRQQTFGDYATVERLFKAVTDAAKAAADADCSCDGTEAKQAAKVAAINAGIAAVVALFNYNNVNWLKAAGCDPGANAAHVRAAHYYNALFWLHNWNGPRFDQYSAQFNALPRNCGNQTWKNQLATYYLVHFMVEGNLEVIYSHID